jgi:predicted nucleic acid-binding protein
VIVISDTSPITNLAAIGQLDLLRRLYTTILIPVAVYDEMASVGKVVPGAVEVKTLAWIKTQAVANAKSVIDIQASHDDIDLGEAEAIVLAVELNADLLLMDERRGRTLAATYGLRVTGLLGVLLQAKCNGLVPLVKPLVDQLMENANFRVDSQLYAMVLQTAGESDYSSP